MKPLTYTELTKISGGHDGEAYDAGKAVGHFLHDAKEVAEGLLLAAPLFL